MQKKLENFSDSQIDYLLDFLSYSKEEKHLYFFEKTIEEKAKRIENAPSEDNAGENAPADYSALSCHIKTLQKAYMSAGLPQKAYALRGKYPGAYSISLPENLQDQSGGKKGWLAYAIKDGGKTLAITDTGLGQGSHIVAAAHWDSDMSGYAFEAMEESEWLRHAFLDLGSYLSDDFSSQLQQRVIHSLRSDRVYSRFSPGEMPALNSGESPAFYFLKDGEVKYSFMGIDKKNAKEYMERHFKAGLEAIYGKDAARFCAPEYAKNVPHFKEYETEEISGDFVNAAAYPPMPHFMDYGNVLSKAQAYQALKFINNSGLYNGCLAAGSNSGISQHYSPNETFAILRGIDFCKPLLGYESGSRENARMADILHGVSPEHRIEFAKSIITKNGHIISAYVGGIEQDLGKEKAAGIAKALAGDNIRYGISCEIEEAPGDSEKHLFRTEKPGYFCIEE